MANRVGIKGLLLLLFIQKRNEERRSSPLFRVLEMQRSAAAAHLFLHDMKPQAMVSIMQTCGILSVETFGRAGEGFFGESGAFVFHIHTQRVGMRRIGEARFGKRKMHRCLGRRVRHRIVHKVHHASRHIGGMGDLTSAELLSGRLDAVAARLGERFRLRDDIGAACIGQGGVAFFRGRGCAK